MEEDEDGQLLIQRNTMRAKGIERQTSLGVMLRIPAPILHARFAVLLRISRPVELLRPTWGSKSTCTDRLRRVFDAQPCIDRFVKGDILSILDDFSPLKAAIAGQVDDKGFIWRQQCRVALALAWSEVTPEQDQRAQKNGPR